MKERESLTIKDAENAQNAILSLIMNYPNFPKSFEASNETIKWGDISPKLSIGLFPLQGAAYLEKYVDGTYLGQMPVQIILNASPTTNKAGIDAQVLLSDMGKWLEKCDISFQKTNIWLEGIERTSTVYQVKIDEKTNGFGMNINMKYTAES